MRSSQALDSSCQTSRIRFKASSINSVGRLTEGFYDTASHRSQQASQHKNSLPKRTHVAKEAVSAARQTKTRQRSERICKPNDASTTKPRPCVKTMLCDLRPIHFRPDVGGCPIIFMGVPQSEAATETAVQYSVVGTVIQSR